MRSAIRSLLTEPRATPPPPRRVTRDWVLAGVVIASTVLEVVLRDDIVWPPVVTAFALALSVVLLVRRTHPLSAIVPFFAAVIVLNVVALVTDTHEVGLYTTAFVLLLPYALFRWASGREVAIGAGLMVPMLVTGLFTDPITAGEIIGGTLIFFLPAELGGIVRYWTRSRMREIEDVRIREREQLARELHDAVAHHVSAIAIQAQAGQATAGKAPSAPHEALDALAAIEREASNTLAEMRTIVGVLRRGDPAELAPQPGVADIRKFARGGDVSPSVEVTLAGDLERLGVTLEAAVYRIAQESVTNALRHAVNARSVRVTVTGDDDQVRVRVEDDGDPVSAQRNGAGYGIRGMTERADLLGGTFTAGPDSSRGWVVDASLPRQVP